MNSKNHETEQDRPRVPVVLIRHAQSLWNRENRFTGWADPPLTDAGVTEAHAAGIRLREAGFQFDAAFSSRLQRAAATLDILLEELGQTALPVQEAWQLNERHYGALQGMDKNRAILEHGEHQVWRWRRGYHDRAQALQTSDPRHSCHDPRCRDIDSNLLPDVENLAETRARVMRYWNEVIAHRICRGERLLISAHGNTLRSLMMDLTSMSVEEVEAFEIPTATPIILETGDQGQVLEWHYLGFPSSQAA